MSMSSRNRDLHLESVKMQFCSVSQLIAELIDQLQPALVRRGVRIEMDVQTLEARIDAKLIGKALQGLMLNAIESTPRGGEITITSINGIHQWEIEVADSSHVRRHNDFSGLVSPEGEPTESIQNSAIQNDDLPTLLQFPRTEYLRDAYRAAFQHDGQIQSWECPQGGMAYVLVIPRRRISKAA